MAGGLEALLRWAAEIGVSDLPPSSSFLPSSSSLGHSLSVSFFPDAGGRGLAAARDLQRGEPVLRVPRAGLLTRDSVLRRDGKLAAHVECHPCLSPVQILTVCLLAEVGKGRDSWWYPYLVQLPRRYDTLANFTQFEIQSLQVDDAIWVAEKAVVNAKSEWKEAIDLMRAMQFRPELLTFKSWLWASATISSRTLHIPWDDAGCLCPVGDLFNYAAPEEDFCSENVDGYSQRLTDGGYEEETASYCFYARKKYQRGDQVLLSYGTYTTLELLEHYGFLLAANPNNKAFIQLDGNLYTLCSWPRDSLYIQPDGRPSFALLCALRIWQTPVKLRRAIGHRARIGLTLSVDNELLVMKRLAENCIEIVQKMPTSVEDDQLLLETIDQLISGLTSIETQSCDCELSKFFQENKMQNSEVVYCALPPKVRTSLERWKLAVQWRIRYKEVLLNCISYCNDITEGLSCQYVSP